MKPARFWMWFVGAVALWAPLPPPALAQDRPSPPPVPMWAMQIPGPLRPTPSQIEQIEKVRREYGLRHEEITMYITGHPETTRKVLRHAFATIKQENPAWSERRLMAAVLMQRIQIGSALRPTLLWLSTASSQAEVDKVVSRFKDIDQLAKAIADEEWSTSTIPPAPGYEAVAKRIDKILTQP